MISERLDKLVEEMVNRGVHFGDAVQEFEKRFITLVLTRQFAGHLTKTADALGMHRNTLSRKIAEHKIRHGSAPISDAILTVPPDDDKLAVARSEC